MPVYRLRESKCLRKLPKLLKISSENSLLRSRHIEPYIADAEVTRFRTFQLSSKPRDSKVISSMSTELQICMFKQMHLFPVFQAAQNDLHDDVSSFHPMNLIVTLYKFHGNLVPRHIRCCHKKDIRWVFFAIFTIICGKQKVVPFHLIPLHSLVPLTLSLMLTRIHSRKMPGEVRSL